MNARLGSDPALSDLQVVMRGLFPGSMGVGVTDPTAEQPNLMPAEMAATEGMVPKRLREFSAGRYAARLAMRAIGQSVRPILMGADRAPIWPEGLRGSIAHCDSACVAVVTSGDETVGVDIEPDLPLEADLIEVITTVDERERLQARPIAERGLLARKLFCAKEAVYKVQYPISKEMFDFHTLNIRFSASMDEFQAVFSRNVGPFRADQMVHGQFGVAAGFMLAGVILEPV